ncbi:MAG TPA: hypothetical protein VFG15_27425 [Amycolatopsis sp.]|nr:hypothetical protein [Amycolatopsis sp.]
MLEENQVRALLTLAMSYDNRRPGELNLAAWHDAANRAGWTYDAAVEAIKDYYASDGRFVMPVDITTKLKATRGLPPRHIALPAPQPASDEHRARMRDLIGNTCRLPDHARHRRQWAPSTPEHTAAREHARAELDGIRHTPGTPP